MRVSFTSINSFDDGQGEVYVDAIPSRCNFEALMTEYPAHESNRYPRRTNSLLRAPQNIPKEQSRASEFDLISEFFAYLPSWLSTDGAKRVTDFAREKYHTSIIYIYIYVYKIGLKRFATLSDAQLPFCLSLHCSSFRFLILIVFSIPRDQLFFGLPLFFLSIDFQSKSCLKNR